MLAEFVNAISKMATEATSARVTPLPGKDAFVVVYPDGETTEYEQEFADQSSLSSFVSLLEFIGSKGGDDIEVIYYKAGKICVVRDCEGKNVINLALDASAVRASVMKLEGGQFFQQKDLVKFLRFKLFGAIPESLVSAFSSVIFDTASQVTGRVGRDEESLGKQVTSRVSGTDAVPDSFIVRYPFYSSEGADVLVESTVFVDIDKENRGFTLYLEPDGLEKAFRQCHSELRTRMYEALKSVESGAPVLEGFPDYVKV